MGSLVARIGLEQRAAAEQRTIGGVPWAPWKSPFFGGRNSFPIGGPAHPARAYYDSEGALSLAAWHSAVRFLSDAVASLGLKTYRRDPQTGTNTRLWTSMLLGDEVSGGGPQADGTLFDWLFSGTEAVLGHGTAVGLITNRSGLTSSTYPLGLPTGIAWLDPERVHIQDNEMVPENTRLAEVFYNGRRMDRDQLVMLRGFTRPGHLAGLSPMRAFATLISQGRSALDYSATFYGNGGWPPSTFVNTAEEVNEQQAKQIRGQLADTIALRQPLVFGRDWTFTPVNIPMDEATMVRTMQLNATQCAAVFGIQPYRCGGTRADGQVYQNAVDAALDEIVSGIMPWTKRWEALLTSLMPAQQYAKFDFSERLRTDPKTKAGIQEIQRNIGTRTVAELRGEDDLDTVKGGDDPFPLSALVSMFRSTRAVPKSMIGLLDFEADRVAATIEGMQQADPSLVGGPPTPPVAMTPAQYLGQQVTARTLSTEQLKAELRNRGELAGDE
jgi:HK97 family phage portal protein